jgi:hypothetical protein
MIVKKALYGLKSSGTAFCAHLVETLFNLNYKSTKANPGIWIQPGVKPDGFKYYKMLLVYVDYVQCISHDPTASMKGIQGTFKLKGDKIKVPTHYLGAQISQKTIGSISCWTMSSEQYIKAAIVNVESNHNRSEQCLPSQCLTQLTSNY